MFIVKLQEAHQLAVEHDEIAYLLYERKGGWDVCLNESFVGRDREESSIVLEIYPDGRVEPVVGFKLK